MEKFPKFIKKVSQIAAVSFIGLVPGQLKGQEIVNNSEHQIKIENNEQLKSQIFDEVGVALNNGVLKNKSDNVYYFEFKNGNYDISYNLDTNFDGEKDSNPQISVSYVDGNCFFNLVKGQNEISNIDRDIVYNYKDNSLSNSESKTYGDFGGENMLVIPELYGKNDSMVHFRKINKEEMKKFLNDIKQFSGVVNSVGIEQNNKNIKNKEEKDEILKKESQIKSKEKESQMEPFVFLYNFLKRNKESFDGSHNEGEFFHLIKGKYSYDFDESGYLKISFIDCNGYNNLIKVELKKEKFGIDQALKIKKNEEGVTIRENITEEQIGKIMSDLLLDIKKM